MKKFIEKLLGIILIIMGIFPFLFKLEKISALLSKVTFLKFLMPGEIAYQLIIVIIGLILLINKKEY